MPADNLGPPIEIRRSNAWLCTYWFRSVLLLLPHAFRTDCLDGEPLFDEELRSGHGVAFGSGIPGVAPQACCWAGKRSIRRR